MAPNDELNSTETNSNISITVETQPEKGSHICSIYRVYDKLRTGKEETYNARFVSIGPYHRKRKSFMVTENHKRWYPHNLIKRFSPRKPSLPDMLEAMKLLETEARECYEETTSMTSDDFVTMMLVDGCFTLELFYKYREVAAKHNTGQNGEKVNDDLIFSSDNVIRRIRMDFVSLENQLPMVVLKSLFELTREDPKDNCSLNKLIMDFLEDILPTTLVRRDYDVLDGKHLLDLVRKAIIPLQPQLLYGEQYPRYIASQLHEAGVKLEVNKVATNLMDIEFDMETGVLKIPSFFHGRCLAMLIPNLMAFEKAHLPYTKEITSYALFLNTLVKTREDVKLLYDAEIIYDGGSKNDVTKTEEEIAYEINTMCAGAVTKMFYYKNLCDDINRYCQIWRAKIKRTSRRSLMILFRDYCNSPWAFLSVLAAIMLLVLTLMQTIYAVRSYSHRI